MSLKPERLKEVRNQRKLTLDELSKRTGVDRSQLYRYEHGSSDTTSASLTALARELGVTTDYLVGLSDEPYGSSNQPLSPDELAILSAYRRADVPTLMEICTEMVRKLLP